MPAIGVQSFRWSLENDQWQGRARTIKLAHDAAAKDLGESEVNAKVCRVLWNKIIPGITEQFDCPSMLRLFAGRALLIVGGTKDPNCPYGGAKLAIASAERAFQDGGERRARTAAARVDGAHDPGRPPAVPSEDGREAGSPLVAEARQIEPPSDRRRGIR